ncbi:hypothetical protein D6D04_07555 [Aureobasidium pullulans]|nr:hypothetical protein D6D04_07555 [Aureobasidium pullulans]
MTLPREPLWSVPTVAASPNDCRWVQKATTRSKPGKETTIFSFQKTYHTVSKRRSSNRTDFELTNFGLTRPRFTKICRMTRDEVPPSLTKISYATTSTNSTLVQSGFARESRFHFGGDDAAKAKECIEFWIKPSVLADRHGPRGLPDDIAALIPQSCQHQQQTSERGEFATVTQGLYDVFVTLIWTPGLAQVLKVRQALPERQYPQDTPNRAQ